MRQRRDGAVALLVAAMLVACTPGASPTSTSAMSTPPMATPTGTETHGSAAPSATAVPGTPVALTPITLLVDTDVAVDDLVALAFLVSARHVTIPAITVSGTGEAHCAGGVDVVLRLLDRLRAPQIPVACGRETPLEGDHAFPDPWRERVDSGAGLDLSTTTREPSAESAVELIVSLSNDAPGLHVLTLGPLTNLAGAIQADAALAERLGPVTIMGGAVHVPGNLVCCGAPEGNAVAEWNIYIDPAAAQIVIDSGVRPRFVSLDGTNQVPVTPAFGARAMDAPTTPARRVLAELFAANPFMTEGSYYLWDPLAAMLAAGYPIGSFTPAAVDVEETEGPESGFTRPTQESPNSEYLSMVDATAAENTLLDVLSGR